MEEYLHLLHFYFKDNSFEWEHAEYFCKNLLINLVHFLNDSNKKKLFKIFSFLIKNGTKDALDFFFDRKIIKDKNISIFSIEDLIKAFVLYELNTNSLQTLSIVTTQPDTLVFHSDNNSVFVNSSNSDQNSEKHYKTEMDWKKTQLEKLIESSFFFTDTCKLFSQILYQKFSQFSDKKRKEFLFYIQDIFSSTSKHYVYAMSHIIEFLSIYDLDFLNSCLFFNFSEESSQILARIKLLEQTTEVPILHQSNYHLFAETFDLNGKLINI
jgi:hypothetical protein